MKIFMKLMRKMQLNKTMMMMKIILKWSSNKKIMKINKFNQKQKVYIYYF